MADEAIVFWETETGIPFTVADATGIEKGTLMKLSDPMAAIISTGVGDHIAGILQTEKIALSGVTQKSIYRRGIFRVKASGTVVAGEGLMSWSSAAQPNLVGSVGAAGVAISGSSFIGTALTSASTSETFLMDLNIGAGGAAGLA